MTTQEILEAARGAKTAVALSDSGTRDSALLGMADALCAPASMDAILAANAEDMAAAKGRISDVMLDRLALTPQRIEAMAKGIRDVAALPDPVGQVLSRIERPNGLVIEKTAVPMGVIAIIFEARPNVTVDAAALCLKSGNVCILRGGKEAHRSAAAIVAALKEGLSAAGLPEDALDDKPACPLCGDTGWRGTEMCRCLRALCAQEQIRELSKLLDLGEQSFGAFRLDYYSDQLWPGRASSPRTNMDLVYEVCLNYAQKFGRFHGEDTYTTKESERLLRLPLYYGLEKEKVLTVCEKIKEFYSK